MKSETSRMKTELKVEVKEEAFEEFDTQEQIGMDIITSHHFDTLLNNSDVSSILTKMKTEKFGHSDLNGFYVPKMNVLNFSLSCLPQIHSDLSAPVFQA